MKSYLITILLFLTLLPLWSQENHILTSKQTEEEILYVSNILHNESTMDSIVNLAIRNSNLLKAMDQEIMMYDEEILQKKRSWISSFRLGVNIFSASTSVNGADQSVTTYGILPNVGLNLSIDPERLVNRASYVRQSTDKKEYSKYIQADNRQIIKKNILNLFYDYLASLEAINIRRQALDGRLQQENYKEASFQNGDCTYEELLIASNQVFLAKEALMLTSVEALKKKSEIEVLIGLK